MELHAILPNTPIPDHNSGSDGFLQQLSTPRMELDKPGEFIPALVHDIRNPLTTINLASEMLKLLITDDYQKECLDIILRGSVKINAIVTDLLHAAVPEENGPQLHSVHQLLDEILVGMADQILLKKIVVSKVYQVNDYKIEFNRTRVKIALVNILINAVEAVRKGTGQVKLVTSFTNGKYMIQIEDNGCGMSKVNLENLFRPFYTNKPGGLGIGMAASYEMLQKEKIEIKVESIPGLGSSFFLLFP